MLSGPEIERQVALGAIRLGCFDPANVGPNSYDVRLGNTLLLIHDPVLDLTRPPEHVETVFIPEDGYVLQPGVGYLGAVVERVRCDGFVPWVDGRSTTGRYFLMVHVTAGRGDDGFDGCFTLEMMALYRPVRVYAGLRVAQLSFFPLEGRRRPYIGSYQGQGTPRLPTPMRRDPLYGVETP